MEDLRHTIPDWVTRGKTIRQLIEELQTFENQDLVVRISVDDGNTHLGISLVQKREEKFCLLVKSEHYHQNDWQDFMDREVPNA